jgi:hypothetical protein
MSGRHELVVAMCVNRKFTSIHLDSINTSIQLISAFVRECQAIIRQMTNGNGSPE